MDELPSAEFRKRYAKLQEPTRVTVNGHLIGIWTPAFAYDDGKVLLAEYMEKNLVAAATGTTAQARRDDLLRKINRGK